MTNDPFTYTQQEAARARRQERADFLADNVARDLPPPERFVFFYRNYERFWRDTVTGEEHEARGAEEWMAGVLKGREAA
jgi:hypothetical protein